MFNQLFGVKKKTPQEQVREWKSSMRSEERKLDRQLRSIQTEEKKAIAEAKKAAQRGDQAVVRILAKEVVQSRKAVKRIHIAKAQMNSVSLALTQQLSQLKLAGSLQKSAQVMGAMNRLVKVGEVQTTMMVMQREMMKAGMIQEQMDDAIDNAMDDEDMDDDVDDEVSKIVDEVMVGQLSGAQAGAAKLPAQQQAQAAQDEEADDDLSKRLQALRGEG